MIKSYYSLALKSITIQKIAREKELKEEDWKQVDKREQKIHRKTKKKRVMGKGVPSKKVNLHVFKFDNIPNFY